jgi:hypothetical protein
MLIEHGLWTLLALEASSALLGLIIDVDRN